MLIYLSIGNTHLSEPRGEFSFLCEGQGALEWVRPERGARALESVAVPAASGVRVGHN